MKIELSVVDPNDDKVISFDDYQFMHVGCGDMKSRRESANNEYVLLCSCGLEIHFPRFGDAVRTITQTVIDRQPRYLEANSFHSNFASDIRINSI